MNAPTVSQSQHTVFLLQLPNFKSRLGIKNPWETHRPEKRITRHHSQFPQSITNIKDAWKEEMGPPERAPRGFLLRYAWPPSSPGPLCRELPVAAVRAHAPRLRVTCACGSDNHKQDDRWRQHRSLSCVNHTPLRPDCTHSDPRTELFGIWTSQFVARVNFVKAAAVGKYGRSGASSLEK